MVKTVLEAEPFNANQTGSFGNASYMLLRQHRFPHDFEDHERLTGADSDRLAQWDRARYEAVMRERPQPEATGYQNWLQSCSPSRMLPFLVKLLGADSNVEWTGYRILVSVNKSNGYPVYSFELFAKDPRSATNVYSGHEAPNVKQTEREYVDKRGFIHFPR